ncbi:hypothetical protein ACOSQ3_028500 [Xanthoceras sorbifolium]
MWWSIWKTIVNGGSQGFRVVLSNLCDEGDVVKVIAMNSHQLPQKGRRMRPIMGHTMHYRRIIITLQPGYFIPPLRKKRI